MSSFQLDQDTGDLKITDNSLTLTDGLEAIRQHLQCRFRFFLGEWFLDTEEGTPWFEDILIKQQTFSVVREVLKKRVLDTPGILSITKFDFDFDSEIREAQLAFSALSQEGPIDFSQIVEVS